MADRTAGQADRSTGRGTARTLFALLRAYTRLDLLWFLRDTRYCLLFMAADLISSGAAIGGVLLLASRFGGLGGMTRDELFFLLAYATLVDGVHALFFANNNMGNISRVIGRGQLDHWIVQPVPCWMQPLASGFSPFSGSSRLLLGLALTGIACARLPLVPGPLWICSLLLGAAASAAIIMAAVYLVSCLAFIAPAAAEEIATDAYAPFDLLKIYPLGGLSPLWRTLFCSVVPVGLAAWLPSRMLLRGRFPGWTVLAAAAYAALASFVFHRGMVYYAAHGSPRYSEFGHRR